MTYRLTTKEDIGNCFGEEGLVVVAERLLAEREAYRKVAATIVLSNALVAVEQREFVVDAEAQRILEKEGE